MNTLRRGVVGQTGTGLLRSISASVFARPYAGGVAIPTADSIGTSLLARAGAGEGTSGGGAGAPHVRPSFDGHPGFQFNHPAAPSFPRSPSDGADAFELMAVPKRKVRSVAGPTLRSGPTLTHLFSCRADTPCVGRQEEFFFSQQLSLAVVSSDNDCCVIIIPAFVTGDAISAGEAEPIQVRQVPVSRESVQGLRQGEAPASLLL